MPDPTLIERLGGMQDALSRDGDFQERLGHKLTADSLYRSAICIEETIATLGRYEREREAQELRNLDYASAVEELRLLREAAATAWRYINGELVDGVREGRHTPEVAANIAEQQARNLLAALQRTGKLAQDGTTGGQFHIPTPHRAALQHAQEQVGDECSCGLKEQRVSLQHDQRCPQYGNPEQAGSK